jgi:hypothetical protein
MRERSLILPDLIRNIPFLPLIELLRENFGLFVETSLASGGAEAEGVFGKLGS